MAGKHLFYGTLVVGALGLTLAGQGLQAYRRYAREEKSWNSLRDLYEYGTAGLTKTRIVMMGDSIGAGCGTENQENSISCVIAREIATSLYTDVVLKNVSVIGAQSRDLLDQVDRIKDDLPDIVIISIGANDILWTTSLHQSIMTLSRVVKYLSGRGVEVFVIPCPNLGVLNLVPQPLRYLLGVLSTKYELAQSHVVKSGGGHTLSVNAILSPMFVSEPEAMFGPDRFHPSEKGYIMAAKAMLPHILTLLEETS